MRHPYVRISESRVPRLPGYCATKERNANAFNGDGVDVSGGDDVFAVRKAGTVFGRGGGRSTLVRYGFD